MGKTEFTRRSLERLPSKEKRYNVLDPETRGLGLVVHPSGERTFFHVAKVLGYPRRTTLGAFEAMSIEQARGQASRINADLAKWKLGNFEGPAPFEKNGEEPTFGELVDLYIEKHLKQRAKRPERAEREVRYTVNAHLAAWKNRKIGTIRRADVQKIHAELGEDRKFAANGVAELVRRLFNFAVEAELWSGENPAAKIKRFHEPSRARFLHPDELARLFTALRKDTNRDLRDFVNLSLWTGARKSDLLSMRWENVSLPDNRWEVPEPKNRQPYAVPLTPEAVKILKDRSRAGDGPWVFPSHGKTGHLVNLKRPWKELLTRSKISDLRVHDLRRTLGSWQAASGASLSIVGKSLGHTSTQATQVYARLDLDPVRASVTAATQAMIAASKKKPKKPTLLPAHQAGAA